MGMWYLILFERFVLILGIQITVEFLASTIDSATIIMCYIWTHVSWTSKMYSAVVLTDVVHSIRVSRPCDMTMEIIGYMYFQAIEDCTAVTC